MNADPDKPVQHHQSVTVKRTSLLKYSRNNYLRGAARANTNSSL